MSDVRLYDTNKGVIPTNEENESLRKPGFVLVIYDQVGVRIKGYYTRKILKEDNMVEEILKGEKTNLNFTRLAESCSIIRRVITITQEAYDKTLGDYKHPGCIGHFARKIGLTKSLDDCLRKHFESKSLNQS